jgi:hypothetical protein
MSWGKYKHRMMTQMAPSELSVYRQLTSLIPVRPTVRSWRDEHLTEWTDIDGESGSGVLADFQAQQKVSDACSLRTTIQHSQSLSRHTSSTVFSVLIPWVWVRIGRRRTQVRERAWRNSWDNCMCTQGQMRAWRNEIALCSPITWTV